MASDNASDKTTKGGTLMKRGEINKNWKIRWFLVKEGKLYYYKRKQDQKFIGMIPLEQSVIRECRDEAVPEFAFEVVTKTRTYYLSASNNNEQKEWMRTLSLHTILHKENELFIQLEEDIENSILAQSLEDERQMKSNRGQRASRMFIKNNNNNNNNNNLNDANKGWNRSNVIGNRQSRLIGKKNGSTGNINLPANMCEIGARLRNSIYSQQEQNGPSKISASSSSIPSLTSMMLGDPPLLPVGRIHSFPEIGEEISSFNPLNINNDNHLIESSSISIIDFGGEDDLIDDNDFTSNRNIDINLDENNENNNSNRNIDINLDENNKNNNSNRDLMEDFCTKSI